MLNTRNPRYRSTSSSMSFRIPIQPRDSCDNSMQKSLLTKRKEKLYLEYLIKEKNRIIGRSEIRRMHEKLNAFAKQSKDKSEKHMKKTQAAVKIQKVVRGWLVRKQYELDFIQISKIRSDTHMQELATAMPTVALFGRNCLKATSKIQKAFRNYKGRQKVRSLQQLYAHWLQDNARINANLILERATRIFVSKFLIIDLKDRQFKQKQLLRIKNNLAMLSIKKYFKANNLSLQDIIQAYQTSRWARLGISLLESKPATAKSTKKSRSKSILSNRMYFKCYKPILSSRNPRLLAPTQSSSSRSRLRLTPSISHKRHLSDFSIFSKPTRPCTPYKF